MKHEQPELKRHLEERHINMMALGAAIGVGLFLGSATAIKMAGPAILIAYAIGGAAMYQIMRALGEMAIHQPVAGSFSRYAMNFISPLVGYLTGWNYWLLWLVTCMAEITAVAVYMGLWFPETPAWIWALAALVLMSSINFIAVKLYGEFEFWFALIKVVTIVLMIVSSLGMIIFGWGNDGIAIGISNLWSNGGFMPHGWSGILMAMQLVMFSYLGIEMIGVTAGEAKNPSRSLVKAINTVFWRIMVFYIGALFVIMAIYPWDQIGTQGSPFVATFEHLGIPAAAGLINFVVLTAALSSCNSGIFSSGRMLYNLAQQKQALPIFAHLSKNGIPTPALLLTALMLLMGVLLNYLAPAEVFIWLTSISTFGAVWTWGVILVAQLRFRRKLTPEQCKALAFRTPLYPFASYLTLIFLAGIIILLGYFPETRLAIVIGPGWLIFLTGVYYLMGFNQQPNSAVQIP